MLGYTEIIDISQPVSSSSAYFPGDTPFSKEVTLHHAENQVINLTAMTMSPHVGTHADAPIHIHGSMDEGTGTIGQAALEPYIGPAVVVDISPFHDEIMLEHVREKLDAMDTFPGRVLFKTAKSIRYEVFEQGYAFFSVELVDYLAENGVMLMGIDTPSVDHVDSKTLPAHHAMHQAGMAWLENLDLTRVEAGPYVLVALPLKLMELEASPVRAVLLR